MLVPQKLLLALIYTCLVLVLSCLVVMCSGCVQDSITYDHVPKQQLAYKTSGRHKRDTQDSPSSLYKPLRIHIHYSLDNEPPLPNESLSRLKEAVQKAASFMSRVLSVVPVQGRLLLSRAGCFRTWGSGVNVGKCSAMDSNYKGREFCGQGVDKIQIPDDHLEGLFIYNATYPHPVTTYYEDGDGVEGDFIIYVTAEARTTCFQQGDAVLAYARYCQQDQHDRPIAAFINFCPFTLQKSDTSRHKIYLTAIHEFIHSLGFTKALYNSYQQCKIVNETLSCSRRSRVIETVLGVQRIATPAISDAAGRHFDCSLLSQSFGVVLDTRGGVTGSHWDEAFMQGSVMAPSIKQPHLTAIDNMTLALFDDMGWYRVDYSHADSYLWGKGSGCQFGLKTTCHHSNNYFCLGSGVGCHYLHQDKGKCSTDVSLAGCSIYMAKPGDECFLAVNAGSTSHLYGEVFNETSRCFLANLTKHGASGVPAQVELKGRCFQHRCNNMSLLVKILDSDWLPCPYESAIQVPGYNGSLVCPKEGILCVDPLVTTTTTSSTNTVSPPTVATGNSDDTTTHSSTSAAPVSSTDITSRPTLAPPVRAEVTFKDADYDSLVGDPELVKDFQNAFVDEVILVTQVKSTQIVNLLLQKGSVLVIFDILPSENTARSPAEVVTVLSSYVSAGNMTLTLYEGQWTFTASSVRKIDPPVEASPIFSSGLIVGVVLGGCLMLTAIIVSFIIVNKYKNRGRVSPSPSRAGSIPREYVINSGTDNDVMTESENHKESVSSRSVRSVPCLATRPSQQSLASELTELQECRKRTSSVESNHESAPPVRPVSTQGVLMTESTDDAIESTMTIT